MNQAKTKKKTPISGATASATCSARGSVYDFGTISPSTTCRIEMKRNATATDTAEAAQVETLPKTLSSTRATAGSPSAPSATDESVMPSWNAAMKRDGSATILRTVRARRLPSAASSSRRVWRTETKAYSAETKNAFQSTQKAIRRSSTAVRMLMRGPHRHTQACSRDRRPRGSTRIICLPDAERRHAPLPAPART